MKRMSIPKAFRDLLDPKIRHRYYAYYGGRGGAKSHSMARALLILGSQRRIKILCVREIQKSIALSVHSLLADLIRQYGLPYRVKQSEIVGRNGTEIQFIGLQSHNAATIKSLEAADIAWVEEAQAISARSWKFLRPTVRKKGSEIWCSWNPDRDTDAVHKFFTDDPPKEALIRKVGYADNPHFTAELEIERQHDEQGDYGEYAHTWLGEIAVRTDATIFPDVRALNLDHALTDRSTAFYGADYGLRDPSVLLKLYRLDLPPCFYIQWEAYRSNVGIEQIPALYETIPDARWSRIKADSAAAMEIQYLRSKGWDIVPSKKGAGSVQSGINFLRSLPIRIHPRCVNALREFSGYRYKIDPKTDAILDEPEEGSDHAIDAARYALESLRFAERNKRSARISWPTFVPMLIGR